MLALLIADCRLLFTLISRISSVRAMFRAGWSVIEIASYSVCRTRICSIICASRFSLSWSIAIAVLVPDLDGTTPITLLMQAAYWESVDRKLLATKMRCLYKLPKPVIYYKRQLRLQDAPQYHWRLRHLLHNCLNAKA